MIILLHLHVYQLYQSYQSLTYFYILNIEQQSHRNRAKTPFDACLTYSAWKSTKLALKNLQNLGKNVLRSLNMEAINQLLRRLQLAWCPSVTYLAIKGPKTYDKGQIPTFSITFPPTPLQCNWLELGKPTRGGGGVIRSYTRKVGKDHIYVCQRAFHCSNLFFSIEIWKERIAGSHSEITWYVKKKLPTVFPIKDARLLKY